MKTTHKWRTTSTWWTRTNESVLSAFCPLVISEADFPPSSIRDAGPYSAMAQLQLPVEDCDERFVIRPKSFRFTKRQHMWYWCGIFWRFSLANTSTRTMCITVCVQRPHLDLVNSISFKLNNWHAKKYLSAFGGILTMCTTTMSVSRELMSLHDACMWSVLYPAT